MSSPFPSNRSPEQIFGSPIKPAFIVGSLAALAGGGFGALRGVVSGRRPIVSALTVGGTWFGFASIYWYTRLGLAQAFEHDTPSSRQKLIFSTVAGGVSGSINAAVQRGARFVWPATVFCSGLGFVGQACWNGIDHLRSDTSTTGNPSILERITQSAWLPLKPVTEEEYESIVSEKLARTKADIAVLEERIRTIRTSNANTMEKSSANE